MATRRAGHSRIAGGVDGGWRSGVRRKRRRRESYATKFPTDGRLVRTEPIDGPTAFALAASLLDCFRSFAEIGGYFLDDLSPRNLQSEMLLPYRSSTDLGSSRTHPWPLTSSPSVSRTLLPAGRQGPARRRQGLPATRHHHSCVGGNSRFANFAGSAAVPVACRDGSVAAPEARGWCIERQLSADFGEDPRLRRGVAALGPAPPRECDDVEPSAQILGKSYRTMTAADPDARPTLTEAPTLCGEAAA